MKSNVTGLAGEFRVMSELLLRGHNSAKSYLEDGADVLLENGLRIEIKSAHKLPQKRTNAYLFDLRRGYGHLSNALECCDYLICWCIDDHLFYIVPSEMILPAMALAIYANSSKSKSKYASYKEAWNLLERR